MKIRLAFDDFELNGYELISPLKGKNPLKLDEYIDNGEADEIICDSILEYVPVSNLMDFIKVLATKIKHGGTIVFTGQDLMMLAEQYIRGEIDILSLNKTLYGLANHAWNFKLSCVTLSDVNEICQQLNLKVLERKLNNTEFVIKVQRQ